MEGKTTLPVEVWEIILDQLEHPFRWSLSHLATWALVDKFFNHLASSRLYKAIRVLPRSGVPVDSEHLAVFRSIANRPALGRYVQVFECWYKNDNSDWFDEPGDDMEERIQICLAVFRSMTDLRILTLTPTAIGEYFIKTCHEKQWSSLQELHIFGINPLRFMWNPDEVSRSNVLSNLTSLVWTFYAEDFQEPFLPPFAPTQADCPLIHTVAFLVAAVELCCPSLVRLEVSGPPHQGALHPRLDQWHNSIAEWMVDHQADFSEVLRRAREAYVGTVPCKLVYLRTLALGLFGEECDDDDGAFLRWASSFFRPQLHGVTTLRIPLQGIVDSRDHNLLIQICASSGPNVHTLVIQSPMNDDLTDVDPSYKGIFAALRTPFSSDPHQYMRTSLQSLTIHHLTPFSPEAAHKFQDFPQLTSLTLSLHVPETHVCINGGWFEPVEFLGPLLNFVAQLPTTLESLKLVTAPPGVMSGEDAEDVSISGVALCRMLPRLRSFDLDLKLDNLGGWVLPYPRVQVYVRRLAHWQTEHVGKVVATTTFLNNDCPSEGDDSNHRWIIKREFTHVQSRSPPFEGLDEDEAYTYTPLDIELVKTCPCKSNLVLWDTRAGTWIKEQDNTYHQGLESGP